MGLLTHLDLPKVLNTSSHDIIEDFFVPILRCATSYDRGVGFFSSGWLRVASHGMGEFADRGGRARWVTSPILSEDDWEAMQTGDNARSDEILKATLRTAIQDLEKSLEHDTLTALAWMIADGVLEFRLAIPRNKLAGGEFHDKFGVFEDAAGNQVSFSGSYNDSIQGGRNYESIKVFWSWDRSYAPHVHSDVRRFEKLWDDSDPNVRVYELPDAAREQIVRLRDYKRPYKSPSKARQRRLLEIAAAIIEREPELPAHIELRDYQDQAIDAWFANQCQGLLEMATGTGKTITSLAAAVKLYQEEGKLAVVISVPYQHLVDQWNDEARAFGLSPILAYKSRKVWMPKLGEKANSYEQGDVNHFSVITTHTTFATEHFQEAIRQVSGSILLIADEVHHLGAAKARDFLPNQVDRRLALSATPDRWFDDVGTEFLRSYFGETVFEFSLADAIGVSLTPYYYYPVLVDLTDLEMEKYRELSSQIAKAFHASIAKDDDEYLTRLLIRRADLLNTASNKLEAISDLVDAEQDLKHVLFYSSPGLIDDLVRLLGWEKRLEVHRFTARENTRTRQRLLREFASGEIRALVAMHCLDEGVDVPSTRTAYILASSSNPRQFIQRRGRVLRKADGKRHARVFDLVTIPPPPDTFSEEGLKSERSILRRELRRFVEFAETAQNKQEAYDVIWGLADTYGVLDFAAAGDSES